MCHVAVTFRSGATVDRDVEHIGSRRPHHLCAVTEAQDEVVGETGGDVQGRSTPAGKTAIPVPVNVAVQRQRGRRVERFLGHHTSQGLVDTDPGRQLADEGDLGRQGGREPNGRASFGVGKRETGRGASCLLLDGFKFCLLENNFILVFFCCCYIL